ncbi:ligand-gated channel protein [Hylemonella gracilis str. Niagara R]|uniref:Ligand-gated channel protein n=1 Tax=Hylemonella gracilis str. Niagara R TaxID=1458275 RepID=A0A016XI79_9BURK|nr:TonB-dependent siderophore receptor [Hylemonella gracilis]EYC51580.1 ligand-gated channel protein [Hylemonella gracilis str. Niagara R]
MAAKTGLLIGADSSLLSGKQAPMLEGSYTPDAALSKLLEGSGLEAVPGANGSYQLRQAPPSRPRSLPEVRVSATEGGVAYVAPQSATGTKTGVPLIETPQSVSVITADRIEAMGASTVKDVLAFTPGVEIAPYGTDSRYDWMVIRGFDAYAPGFYQDGLQLRNTGNWAIWQTENYGLERIEILRGPSSVLYGQNGPGGLVNVVSKQPLDERRNEIQVQAGSHARKQLAGDFTGPLNEDGSVLYRVVGLARDAEMPEGGMPDDRFYLAPSLTLKPSAQTSLTLLSQILRSRAGTYVRSLPEQGSLVRTPAGTKLPTDTYLSEPDFNRLNQDQWSLGYLLEHKPSDRMTLRQNLRYARLDMDYRQVSLGSFVTYNADVSDPINYREMTRSVYASREKSDLFTIDNQAQLEFDTGELRHTLLAGFDYQNGRFDQTSYFSGTVDNIDLYNPVHDGLVTLGAPDMDQRTRLIQAGFYLQDQVKWGNWVATVAGRHDRATIELADHLNDTRSSQVDRKFSTRAGLVYLHPSGWAPYASYATSFVPNTTINPDTGDAFDPETGRQIEAGIRYQPVNHKAMYSAAIFDLRRQDYVTTDPSTNQPKQTGEIVVRGLELEALVTPYAGFNLTTAYAYTPKADVTQSENPAEVGKQATAVATHRFSLWGDYRFEAGLKAGFGMRYVGPTRGINESAATQVPGYTLIDAMVGYDMDRWSLALNASNLTDKEYIANCGYGSCYYGTQRRVVMTSMYRW